MGDFHAQIAGGDVGGERLLEFMDEFGFERLEPLADEIIERTERAMRESIGRLRPGVYAYSITSDGFDEPITIAVRCEVRGDELWVDYTGSSPESRRGINVVMNYTEAYTTYGVKVIVSPDVPNNEGAFRPLRITAPAGLHPERAPPRAGRGPAHRRPLPAPRGGRRAREALPDASWPRARPTSGASRCPARTRRGGPSRYVFFTSGGTGARPSKDGLSATAFPSGVLGTPVEVIETLSPAGHRAEGAPRRLRRRRALPRRARPGDRASACARRSPSSAPSSATGRGSPPRASSAASRARPGEVLINGRPPANPKAEQILDPGELVEVRLPGGGGYGPPAERDPALRARDLLEGYA